MCVCLSVSAYSLVLPACSRRPIKLAVSIDWSAQFHTNCWVKLFSISHFSVNRCIFFFAFSSSTELGTSVLEFESQRTHRCARKSYANGRVCIVHTVHALVYLCVFRHAACIGDVLMKTCFAANYTVVIHSSVSIALSIRVFATDLAHRIPIRVGIIVSTVGLIVDLMRCVANVFLPMLRPI